MPTFLDREWSLNSRARSEGVKPSGQGPQHHRGVKNGIFLPHPNCHQPQERGNRRDGREKRNILVEVVEHRLRTQT